MSFTIIFNPKYSTFLPHYKLQIRNRLFSFQKRNVRFGEEVEQAKVVEGSDLNPGLFCLSFQQCPFLPTTLSFLE
jgi:hypothetical protein